MKMVKSITQAVMTLTLSLFIGCQAPTANPPVEEKPLSEPTGIETPQDASLGQAVRERLLAEKGVDLSRVIVETRKGTVYLSGVVLSLDARNRAVTISWRVAGVQTVINHLQVGE